MQLARPAFARHPRHFGRAVVRSDVPVQPPRQLSDDARLFATTFMAGFVFVSVLIA